MNPRQDLNYLAETGFQIYLNYMGILSPNWEWYGVFNPYNVIDYHGFGGNHINGIIDLTDRE